MRLGLTILSLGCTALAGLITLAINEGAGRWVGAAMLLFVVIAAALLWWDERASAGRRDVRD